jgi:hypothetical protein
VLLSDGFFHRRFFYNNQQPMIEGVGSTNGLLSPWPYFEIIRNMKCLSHTNPSRIIYSSAGNGFPCPVIASIPRRNNGKPVALFPNPASETLNLGIENGVSSIEITNVTGVKVRTIDRSAAGIQTVDIRDLPAGLYIVSVGNGDIKASGYFIKN